MKAKGQKAYEAYYESIGGWAQVKHWDMLSDDEKRCWANVEFRLSHPVESKIISRIKKHIEQLQTELTVQSVLLDKIAQYEAKGA